jgi:hypothetical protein
VKKGQTGVRISLKEVFEAVKEHNFGHAFMGNRSQFFPACAKPAAYKSIPLFLHPKLRYP